MVSRTASREMNGLSLAGSTDVWAPFVELCYTHPLTEECDSLAAEVTASLALGAALSATMLGVWSPVWELTSKAAYWILTPTGAIGMATASGTAIAVAIGGSLSVEIASVAVVGASVAAGVVTLVSTGHAVAAATVGVFGVFAAGFVGMMFAGFAAMIEAIIEAFVAAIMAMMFAFGVGVVGLAVVGTLVTYAALQWPSQTSVADPQTHHRATSARQSRTNPVERSVSHGVHTEEAASATIVGVPVGSPVMAEEDEWRPASAEHMARAAEGWETDEVCVVGEQPTAASWSGARLYPDPQLPTVPPHVPAGQEGRG